MHGELEYLQSDVDYALDQLGVDYIDIIVLCRVPTNVTIEVDITTKVFCLLQFILTSFLFFLFIGSC